MSAWSIPCSVMLAVAAAIPTPQAHAAPAQERGARKTLHAAAFEAAPPATGHGRFRLSAQWHPAPAPAIGDRARTLKLAATLAPKATACPLPGRIFADGYESP